MKTKTKETKKLENDIINNNKNKPNIVLVGTSHISKESVIKLKQNFDIYKPKYVCVELDRKRTEQLFSKRNKSDPWSAIRNFGIFGGVFIIIGSLIQKKLGKQFNMLPGEEMKQAILVARKTNSKIYLVDKDIEKTVRGISQIPFSEKAKIFGDLILGLISTPFVKLYSKLGGKKEDIYEFDLSSIPDDKVIEKIMKMFKDRYPHIYSELIGKRNQFMVNKIIAISKLEEKGNILVVIGAGHKKGMIELLRKSEISKEYNFI